MFCSLALAAALLLAPGPSASDGEPAAAGPEESAKEVGETFSGTWGGRLTITRSGRPPPHPPAGPPARAAPGAVDLPQDRGWNGGRLRAAGDPPLGRRHPGE